jgi:molybdenum cofactor biosynthesis enzyme MoaA
MTRNAIFRFLDDAAEIGVKAISFMSDGESTCSTYLYDAIFRGKANRLDMSLATNGYLLKQDQLEEILSALTYLRFNMSACEPERYAQLHGCKQECFYKVCDTIKKCVEIKAENHLEVTIGIQEVLNLIASKEFDAKRMCGCLCLQHKVNEFLWDIKMGKTVLENGMGSPPMHVNFV